MVLAFDQVLTFIEQNGYVLLFLLMILEGPIVTAAAAFAASLGYLSLPVVFILSVLGNIIGDLI